MTQALTLRIDLDYVPWDTPDANEFGHGEPAMILRLLDLARTRGWAMQFYVSNRVLHAFPATVRAVAADGHPLDWFCKHPEDTERRLPEALTLFGEIGLLPQGLSVRTAWPDGMAPVDGMTFLSSPPGHAPEGMIHFPVLTPIDRDAIRSGLSARAWAELIRGQIRTSVTHGTGSTVCVRPQVLAKFDPHLRHLRDIVDLGLALGLHLKTHRELATGLQAR